jgi:hypothetical protein
MADTIRDYFASPDRVRLVREQLRQASTDDDGWEIVEATISYTKARRDPAVWEAIAADIPATFHHDARQHLALIDDGDLRRQMEQALPAMES